MMSPEGFFFGVTTQQGTSYILTVEDKAKFAAFAQKTMDNVGPGLPFEWVYDSLCK